MDYLCAKFWRF